MTRAEAQSVYDRALAVAQQAFSDAVKEGSTWSRLQSDNAWHRAELAAHDLMWAIVDEMEEQRRVNWWRKLKQILTRRNTNPEGIK